jgi:translation initiation factor 1
MSKKNLNRKGREGIVFSTDPEFHYQYNAGEQQETLPPEKQDLRVLLDKKLRGGKQATLVTGFVGSEDDLKELGKILKTKCGVGGSAREGEILVQGDAREKVLQILGNLGYKAKRIN